VADMPSIPEFRSYLAIGSPPAMGHVIPMSCGNECLVWSIEQPFWLPVIAM